MVDAAVQDALENSCFDGLNLKNTGTGLYNRIDVTGADGAQALSFGDGAACP
jgi:phage major head subunit gpT-like protein